MRGEGARLAAPLDCGMIRGGQVPGREFKLLKALRWIFRAIAACEIERGGFKGLQRRLVALSHALANAASSSAVASSWDASGRAHSPAKAPP